MTEAAGSNKRLDSIDIVRGLVMVVMALDHLKGGLSNIRFDFLDLEKTTYPIYFTRWISHLCAPAFVLLAGTGAYLFGSRGRSKSQIAGFLLSRGLWILFLEFTWVKFFLFGFQYDVNTWVGMVLWAIGCSMIALAILSFLPRPIILVFGLLMIFGHNSLDGIKKSRFTSPQVGNLWAVMHSQEAFELPSLGSLGGNEGGGGARRTFIPAYPLIPWIGVMACGYCLGAMYQWPAGKRRLWLIGMGISAIAIFCVLRGFNIYGDPRPWTEQARPGFNLLAILNCQKYPPSLSYLLMTLGPTLIALALAELDWGPAAQTFAVYGRVPMFYYLLHMVFTSGAALVFAYWKYGDKLLDLRNGPWPPPGWGLPLYYLYFYWVLIVALLYLPCLWFGRLKARSKSYWLSYF